MCPASGQSAQSQNGHSGETESQYSGIRIGASDVQIATLIRQDHRSTVDEYHCIASEGVVRGRRRCTTVVQGRPVARSSPVIAQKDVGNPLGKQKAGKQQGERVADYEDKPCAHCEG